MTDKAPLPEQLIDEETEKICKRYRIDPETARERFLFHFQKEAPRLNRALSKSPETDIRRLKEYKQVVKQVRKRIYYGLRQYHGEENDQALLADELKQAAAPGQNRKKIESLVDRLLFTHVSTRERRPHYPAFYQILFDRIGSPRTVLDLGCGLHPLSFPFRKQGRSVKKYVAVDRDPNVAEILKCCELLAKPAFFQILIADFADLHWEDLTKPEDTLFDVAFLLKLVPVLYRQNRKLLSHLETVPAKYMVVTGCVESMVRKENIERREKKAIYQFMETSGRKILAEFRIENEFGYILTK